MVKIEAVLLECRFFYEIKYLRDMQKQAAYSLDEAQKKIEHYCAYQERCHQEVVQKLRQMKMIPQAIDVIIGKLIQENYLNETRFAQSFARGKFRIKKWGKDRIVRDLKMRQISAYNIKIALKEIPEEDYLNTLSEIAEKFWQSNAHRTIALRKKKVIDALRYRARFYQVYANQIHGKSYW